MSDSASGAPAPIARLTGIVRRFGSVVALDGADLKIRLGEVHGVLGANGAGKTTLLSVLGGMLVPDSGAVEIDGEDVRLRTPRDAWAHGIALVHQHFTLVPALTVLDNLALGLRRGSGLALDLAAVRAEAASLVARTGLEVPLDRPVERLGVGDRQRTEILKALMRDPRVLVLDEPTAVLAPSETEGLFNLLRDLAAGGRAVVLVAHKLDEVLSVADRITVLRNGRTVLTGVRSDVSEARLVQAMVGGGPTDPLGGDRRADEAPSDVPRRTPAPAGAPVVARLADVVWRPSNGGPGLREVTLEARRGEVVGVAGVEGNGQHQLALVLGGRASPDRGEVTLPPGIGYIPQDRSAQGLIGAFDISENVALALQHDPEFHDGPWMRWDALVDESERLRRRYDIAAPTVRTLASALSGGNQQRVVVARELAVAADLLVAENPTRGLDVTATAFVHGELRRLTERAGEGPAVVLISTDLDEVLELSDRLFAMSRGRLIAVPPDQRTREGVGALMLRGGRDRA